MASAAAAEAPAPVDEATLARVRQHMHAVRIPSYHDKVYKEECMFTYDSPESPGGLYVNLTTFQVLFALPEVAARYAEAAPSIFASAPTDPAADLPTQLAKVGAALVAGRTGHVQAAEAEPMEVDGGADLLPLPDDERARASFKSAAGRGHAEFSSGRQQDAAEYFTHLLELVPLEAAVNSEAVADYKDRQAKRQRLKEQQAQARAYIGATPEGDEAAVATVTADGEGLGTSGGGAVHVSGPGSGSLVVVADAEEEAVLPRVPFEACLQRFSGTE
ncbi:Ubiquitin carboxyl-terminal hydrolase 5, partial [Tetrabaena socialis]